MFEYFNCVDLKFARRVAIETGPVNVGIRYIDVDILLFYLEIKQSGKCSVPFDHVSRAKSM